VGDSAANTDKDNIEKRDSIIKAVKAKEPAFLISPSPQPKGDALRFK
jgi:hypothetical protein